MKIRTVNILINIYIKLNYYLLKQIIYKAINQD
jgi:hypothetical protein